MEASAKGIDISSSALAVLVAFAGDNADQAQAFFKVKGGKLLAAATSKRFAIELEGKAGKDAENGEWPVHKSFLADLAKVTVDGSPKVPAIHARLLLERTGVSKSDLIVKETGVWHGSHQSAVVLPEKRQLSFKQIHDTITVDFDSPGPASWFPLEKKAHRALSAVYAAVPKNTPVGVIAGKDADSAVGFQAQADGFVIRGIIMPPAVQGPGKAVTEDDDEEDEEEGGSAEARTGNLFERRPITADEPLAEDGGRTSDDDPVIDDEEAERIKREQQSGKPLASEKKPRKAKKAGRR
jgi:hypothetical protein